MTDPDAKVESLINFAIAIAFAAIVGAYFFFRVPRIPGIPNAWWLVFSLLIAAVSLTTSLVEHWIASFLTSRASRMRSLLRNSLWIGVSIESAIAMSAVLGQIGGIVFGACLAMVLVVCDVLDTRRQIKSLNNGQTGDRGSHSR